jgi:Leucine-rich repeat (LRR) protein
MNEDIVEFRGARIIEAEAQVLQELENRCRNFLKYSIKFSLVDELNIDGLGDGMPLQFSAESNHITLIAISDPNYCEDCKKDQSYCDECGISVLPESLGNLRSLKELFLVFNEEKGVKFIPESLNKLQTLERLTFRYTKLKELPNFITQLLSLRFLDLTANKFKFLPESLGLLINLESLDLRSNSLSDLPESIANLGSLKILNLGGNKFNYIPETIFNLQQLRELNISVNNIKQIPELLGNLILLEKLDLYQNKLISLPNSIGKLTSLLKLDIHNNQLTSLPEFIGNLKSLKEFNLERNILTSLPESIGKLESLESFILAYNQLPTLPTSFGNLLSLKYLFLDKNKLISLPESFGDLKSLEQLYIEHNRLESLPQSISKLKSLYHLNLSNNNLELLPDSLGNMNPDLKLVLWEYKTYANMTLEESLTRLKSLKKYQGKIFKQKKFEKPLLNSNKKTKLNYPPEKLLIRNRRNFELLILWMVKNNDVVEWDDFKEEPIVINQSTLAKSLSNLLRKEFIKKVRKSTYKITPKGKKRYNEMKEAASKKKIVAFPPEEFLTNKPSEVIILWMFYHNENLKWSDFLGEDSPVRIDQVILSEFLNVLLENSLIVKDDENRYKITQKGKAEYFDAIKGNINND